MGDVPFATALIEGHTDNVGGDAYNLKLSDRRAKAVLDYLTSRGVDPARLKSVGKGETAPVSAEPGRMRPSAAPIQSMRPGNRTSNPSRASLPGAVVDSCDIARSVSRDEGRLTGPPGRAVV